MLSSSSPVIEVSKLIEVESQSDSISAIEVPASMWLVDLCAHCIDNLFLYAPELCSYWGCSLMFHKLDKSEN